VICALDMVNIVIVDDGVDQDIRDEMELLGLQLIVV
jgi:hypothetical protein